MAVREHEFIVVDFYVPYVSLLNQRQREREREREGEREERMREKMKGRDGETAEQKAIQGQLPSISNLVEDTTLFAGGAATAK